MNWIVTWMVITWSLIACPPPAPVCDAYRGELQQMNVTALACYDTTETPMNKYFSTYDEALEFVKNGQTQCSEIGLISRLSYMGDCDLKDFKIKEVKPMEKYFSTYEEALGFVENGKGQCGNNSDIISIPIVADCDLKGFKITEVR